jgi:hypothetical protein
MGRHAEDGEPQTDASFDGVHRGMQMPASENCTHMSELEAQGLPASQSGRNWQTVGPLVDGPQRSTIEQLESVVQSGAQ